MEEKSLFDTMFMSKGEAEKELHVYTSGAKKHCCHPTEEPDGTIDLHGPDGQVLAKCYDAQCAMFVLTCLDMSAEYGLLKIEADILHTAIEKVKADIDRKKAASESKSPDAKNGNPFSSLMDLLTGKPKDGGK